MAKEGNQISSQSAKHQGSPSSGGQSKAESLSVNERSESEEQKLQDDAADAPQTHPNRGGSKSDSGKGSYS
ncbi:hypothetical protein [Hymenobacter mucosus]|uniref:Uncharacterized protein n=1 Tax=Hymenobacter mucosus TaxID=1411120 RepID=A0A238WUD9_9BACT|nr:hypothetical protein [Hymenobacter mucosus]SNR50167.1 hypothetical protein SAMN06269173_103110 [Hymenobacter mucosus]